MTPTTNDRRTGILLILGSLSMIITMVLHPHGSVAPNEMASLIRLSIAVHSFSLLFLPLQFLAVWGLSRRLNADGEFATTGLAVYGFGLVAIMNAAVMNGLVWPTIVRQMAETGAPAAAVNTWQAISRYNFAVNQAFAAVFVVASSLAILLWCISGWGGKLPRGLAIYGCVIAPVTVLLLLAGHLKLDVHGFGMVIFTEAAWFVIAGIALLRSNSGEQIAAS